MPGPVPSRESQRRRTNSPPVEKGAGAALVPVPEPDEGWHPAARRWFVALGESGQARWYEPSDWATAALIAESMSRDLKPQVVGVTDDGDVVEAVVPLKGASLAAYLKAMTALLVTEGDRRRARIELERPEESVPADSPVALLDEYRAG